MVRPYDQLLRCTVTTSHLLCLLRIQIQHHQQRMGHSLHLDLNHNTSDHFRQRRHRLRFLASHRCDTVQSKIILRHAYHTNNQDLPTMPHFLLYHLMSKGPHLIPVDPLMRQLDPNMTRVPLLQLTEYQLVWQHVIRRCSDTLAKRTDPTIAAVQKANAGLEHPLIRIHKRYSENYGQLPLLRKLLLHLLSVTSQARSLRSGPGLTRSCDVLTVDYLLRH